MKNKFLYRLLSLALGITLIFTACGQADAPSPGPSMTEPPATVTEAPADTATEVPANSTASITEEPTEAPTAEPAEPIDWYQQMLNTSILSTGDNGRLNQVLAKLANGEEVSIAMIGGSITEGAGADLPANSYGDIFVNSLQQTYPEATIHYCNAGLGNTPSTLGLMRYERDVTSKVTADTQQKGVLWQETTGLTVPWQETVI